MREFEEFKVESKPIPIDLVRKRYSRYPFAEMKVGQSFYIKEGFKAIQSVRSSASLYGKRHDMKFVVVRDGKGYRCGRIK